MSRSWDANESLLFFPGLPWLPVLEMDFLYSATFWELTVPQSNSLHCTFLFSCSDLWSPPQEEEEEITFAWWGQRWSLVCFGAVLSELILLKWPQVKRKRLNKRSMLVKVMHVSWICRNLLIMYCQLCTCCQTRNGWTNQHEHWGTSGSYRHGLDVTTSEGSDCSFEDNSRFW